MGNLNLAIGKKVSSDFEFPYKAGIFSIVAVAAVLMLVYWGMGLYGKDVDGKRMDIDKKYDEQKAILTGNKNRDIIDFQNRIIVAKGLVGEEPFSIESFSALEKSIVEGAWLISYDYNKESGDVKLNYAANNFNIMAQQILALKNSDFFSEISLGRSGLGKDGKASFDITLKIKSFK